MIELWVELSGENLPLAAAEAAAAAEALGGASVPVVGGPPAGTGCTVRVPDLPAARALAARLSYARRCLRPLAAGVLEVVLPVIERRAAGTAAFRPVGRPRGGSDAALLRLAGAWRAGGGTIDLSAPQHRFFHVFDGVGQLWVGEEVAAVDRGAFRARRMPTLPFRRPVSLPPPRARLAANLARIRPGDLVVDPFVGTGALLAEAALLGARVAGADRDATMVRGCLANLAHLGLSAELVRVADAGEPFDPPGGGRWDAILTDPPYGRSSGTHGERPDALLRRALGAWGAAVRPGGFLSVVAPETAPRDLGAAWELRGAYPDRVHRSLTREFRCYRRAS